MENVLIIKFVCIYLSEVLYFDQVLLFYVIYRMIMIYKCRDTKVYLCYWTYCHSTSSMAGR